MSCKAEIAELLSLSARLGRDPLLVQASSGNTSIKLDGTLWIKASGKWLAYANEETLVPIELAELREKLRASPVSAEFAGTGARGALPGGGVRVRTDAHLLSER